ncbi:dihydrofolate reductase [Secundilactobacillus oryzae JCM 18671]|uniref:Dihydrofolate reductase n=1 Tax=Secundilactobacillus oryzae JCM 18671 TaxID=1291743 RepID=A0A081BIN5_9LACO|nr:dihydrofolate reductase family protein [Secundilactobacillus oryzae]GAK47903.1 dihydrofolate reductase [Secundilactobacillus oryzae JCM 18671]
MDGYLANRDRSLQWLFDTAGGEEANTDQFLADVDTAVMGRKTYEETKQIMADEPMFPGKQNIVLSSTRTGDVEDATFHNGDVVSLVRQLREQDGQNIWIVGGGKIVTELLQADLIDDWWIQIAPVVLGSGIRLFPEGDYFQRFKLVDVTHYDQLAEVRYTRLD